MTNDEAIDIFRHLYLHKKLEIPSVTLKQALYMAIKALEQEPKTGHWIIYDNEYFTTGRLAPLTHSIRECSECHIKIADFCGKMEYCPNCGARMESEDKK